MQENAKAVVGFLKWAVEVALWVDERWKRISSRILKMNRGGLPSDPKEG